MRLTNANRGKSAWQLALNHKSMVGEIVRESEGPESQKMKGKIKMAWWVAEADGMCF